jgi:hypothetical protein
MIVILCHPTDASALWLHGALAAAGARDNEIVTVEQLVYSRRIVHRMNAAGDAGAIHLADGRVLCPEAITGLVNRTMYVPTGHFAAAGAADRAYATSELAAFLLAWLHGVAGRVINPPLPFALDGGSFDRTTVVHLAAQAGLPTTPLRLNSQASAGGAWPGLVTHRVVVFDGRIFGQILPRSLQDGCRRLAALLGVPLLQIDLRFVGSGSSNVAAGFSRTGSFGLSEVEGTRPTAHGSDEQWSFVAATGMVDFAVAGSRLAAALARVLEARAA